MNDLASFLFCTVCVCLHCMCGQMWVKVFFFWFALICNNTTSCYTHTQGRLNPQFLHTCLYFYFLANGVKNYSKRSTTAPRYSSPTSLCSIFLHVNVIDIDELKLIMLLVGTPGPELLMKISSESVSVRHPRFCCSSFLALHLLCSRNGFPVWLFCSCLRHASVLACTVLEVWGHCSSDELPWLKISNNTFLRVHLHPVFVPSSCTNVLKVAVLFHLLDMRPLDSDTVDINQLQQIMRLTGTPPASLISRMPSHEVRPLTFQAASPGVAIKHQLYVQDILTAIRCIVQNRFRLFTTHHLQTSICSHFTDPVSCLSQCSCRGHSVLCQSRAY